MGLRRRMKRAAGIASSGSRFGAIIGGPAYQMNLDARHAGSMVGLALALRERVSYFETHWAHGCPVEAARNGMFGHALAGRADVLFWADADVFWSPEDTGSIVWLMGELATHATIPCAAIPVMQRNGDSNIVERIEGEGEHQVFHRLRQFGPGDFIRPCAAAGTGIIAFNLAWYRKHWPLAPWFRTEWHGSMSVSEDLWHTSQLRTRGASCHFAPIVATTHAARGVVG